MKQIIVIIVLAFCVLCGFAQNNPPKKETTSQLASKYYSQKNYEKAGPLYKSLFETSQNSYYFKMYFRCLISLEDYELAEKEITREIKKDKKRPEYYVYLGYIQSQQKREEEAEENYQEALRKIPNNKSAYLTTANTFIQWGLYEYAKNTYLQGKTKLNNEEFHFELARSYYYLRNYDLMMTEYLNYLRLDEKNLEEVQSNLSSVLRLDFNNELHNKFRSTTLKQVQLEPNVLSFNRLLIWFFLQEGKFANALRQSVALDKRTGMEDAKILALANMALNNKKYMDAENAYTYLLEKGKGSPYYTQSFILNLKASYMHFVQEESNDRERGKQLAEQMKEGIDSLGKLILAHELIIDYADILAFYIQKPDEAINVLNQGLKIPGLNVVEIGRLKTKLADIYVYNEDPWEATLIYSQVIDANKKNSLGDEVKLKKARLGYYLGNFSWAKAQLDVLKASTSKLTSNDAFELSLFIGENLNLDTTEVPLKMFARADLYFFQNKDSMAYASLDSIESLFPYHTLVDDILMRKAKINIQNRNYLEASGQLQQIIDEFSFEKYSDDALYLLASLNHHNLANEEKAQELYKQLITQHPGSIYVVDARKNFRILRGDFIEEEPELNKEDLFFKYGI